MRKKAAAILWIIYTFVACTAWGQNAVELARSGQEFSTARLEPARMLSKAGIAIIFEGTDDLHYYAKPETAPAEGLELKVEAKSDDFRFGDAIFPKWSIFQDAAGKKVEVYAGSFTVFIPFDYESMGVVELEKANIEVRISGVACTSIVCLAPFEKTLQTTIDLSQADSYTALDMSLFDRATSHESPVTDDKASSYSVPFALLLAFLAGLSLNIMPCVWPVLPIIVMRIIRQSQQNKAKTVSLGLTFCVGILLFFACLAVANIILQVFYGTVLQWGDQFRNPAFLAAMSLLLVVLALFMFGLFTITVPSSIAGYSGPGQGYIGSVGMGFLAAILSTPCSFGILAAAFAWAQAQPLQLATIAIMVMGIGMALPYAMLTSMPGLLNRLPKAGRWMELFKQALGFILLFIAVKLLKGIPDNDKINVLYFAVVLSFCIWMWFSWVSSTSKLLRKLFVRALAVVLAVLSFRFFFAPELVNWQDYNETVIEKAIDQQQPVLIKFTADWCANCEVIDKLVYNRRDIAQLIRQKNVLAIYADTTERNFPATIALKNMYNEPAVPVSILFMPGRKEPLRWHGILFTDELKKSLQELTSEKEYGEESKD
jgi:thiol:disulfide interchange protein DsbD